MMSMISLQQRGGLLVGGYIPSEKLVHVGKRGRGSMLRDTDTPQFRLPKPLAALLALSHGPLPQYADTSHFPQASRNLIFCASSSTFGV